MIVTHVKANKMVCAMHSHDHDFGRKRFCISDQCMAWRPTGIKTQGFCGMAGRPILLELEAAEGAAKRILEGVR